MPPPCEAMIFRFGYRSKNPSKIIRVMASVVSNMKPTDQLRSNFVMSIMSTPGGSVGCTSTGSARLSISAQIGSNSGSVRLRPATLASTMTPTAPLPHVRASSSIARCGYSQGSDVNQRMRSGYVRLRLRHRVVRLPRRAAADVFVAPVNVGTGERDDRNVDACRIHVLASAGRSRNGRAAESRRACRRGRFPAGRRDAS